MEWKRLAGHIISMYIHIHYMYLYVVYMISLLLSFSLKLVFVVSISAFKAISWGASLVKAVLFPDVLADLLDWLRPPWILIKLGSQEIRLEIPGEYWGYESGMA